MTIAEAAMPANAHLSWRKTAGAVGVTGLVALAALAGIARFIAPFAPGMLNAGQPLSYLNATNIFGADALGRDIYSETLYGLGVTMSDAGFGFLVVLAAGTIAGFLAGHALGRAGIAARIGVDVLISIPALLSAILISVLMGQGHAAIAAGLAAAPAAFARAYDRARAHLAAPYADFARATGVDGVTLFQRDLVCELRDALIPTAARAFAAVTITLATMSFFGFGAVAPVRDLGLLIAANQNALPEAWWTALFPAAALALLILSARLAAGLSGGERP
jgi:peptide/nickel transport system permease protein